MFKRIVLMITALLLLAGGGSWASLTMPPKRTEAPTTLPGMFALYEQNREQGIGNYITVDFVLTAYNLMVRDLLTSVEEKEISSAMKQLAAGLVAGLQKDASADPGRRLALGYAAVLQKLLDPAAQVPAAVASQVEAELKLINTATAVEPSPLFGVKDDYSQYKPRGKYAASEAMSRYFRALMYTGRMGFYLKESKATGVTAQMADQQTAAAQAIIAVIQSSQALLQQYELVNRSLDFFVGKSDDLTIEDYAAAQVQAPAAARAAVLAEAKKAGRLPRILGGLVDVKLLEAGVSLPEVTAGFRLIGQRATVESQIFQKLTFNSVGEYQGSKTPPTMVLAAGKKVRGFPTLLDLSYLLGSRNAAQLITQRDDHNYAGYTDMLQQSWQILDATLAAPASLTDLNLRMAELLARKDQDTNAALGLWVQNRHNFLLYAKQSYTAVAKGFSLAPEDTRSFAQVENNLPLYAAIVENLYKINEQIATPELKKKVAGFRTVLDRMRVAAERQQRDISTADDYRFLNNLDKTLAGMLTSKDQPVVVDIHTDANSGKVLEEGIGFPRAETYTYTDKAKGSVRGAVYSVHEFTWPMDKRLTDEEWKVMLQKGQATGNLTEPLRSHLKH